MSLRRVLALSLRIVRQFVRDRRSLALLFVAPLLVMTLLNFVLNGSTAGVTLGIVPPDGPLGAQIVNLIRARAGGQNGLTITTVARDRVDATLKNGDADGVLVFPSDLLSTPANAQVALRLEGSDPGKAQQLRGLVTQMLAALSQATTSATSGGTGAPPASL